jgi:hypothetical protein
MMTEANRLFEGFTPSEKEVSHIALLLWKIPSQTREQKIVQILEILKQLKTVDRKIGRAEKVYTIAAAVAQSSFERIHRFTEYFRNLDRQGAQFPTQLPFVTTESEIERETVQLLINYGKELDCFRRPTIFYHDSQGVDLGGLMRDFLTRLFSALNHADPSQFSVRRDEKGLMLPASSYLSPRSFLAYQAIGKIFNEILLGRLNARIGERFSPVLFEMMHALNDAEIKQFSASAQDKLLQIYCKRELPHLKEEEIRQILKGIIPAGWEVRSKEEFIESIGFEPIAAAVLQILKSIQTYSIWNTLKRNSPRALMDAIQGTISSEAVIAQLQPSPRIHSNAKMWMERWLREANLEQLRQFLFSVTGSETLGDKQIVMEHWVTSPQALPCFHTCSSQMDLPPYPDYETFKAKLEMSVAHCVAKSEQSSFQLN